jgi:predicted nuclease with TOPRIM domain
MQRRLTLNWGDFSKMHSTPWQSEITIDIILQFITWNALFSLQRDKYEELLQEAKCLTRTTELYTMVLGSRLSQMQDQLDQVNRERAQLRSKLRNLRNQLEVSKVDFSLRMQSLTPYCAFLKEIMSCQMSAVVCSPMDVYFIPANTTLFPVGRLC